MWRRGLAGNRGRGLSRFWGGTPQDSAGRNSQRGQAEASTSEASQRLPRSIGRRVQYSGVAGRGSVLAIQNSVEVSSASSGYSTSFVCRLNSPSPSSFLYRACREDRGHRVPSSSSILMRRVMASKTCCCWWRSVATACCCCGGRRRATPGSAIVHVARLNSHSRFQFCISHAKTETLNPCCIPPATTGTPRAVSDGREHSPPAGPSHGQPDARDASEGLSERRPGPGGSEVGGWVSRETRTVREKGYGSGSAGGY